MATTTLAGYAFPQFNDYDDPQNFAFHLGQSNLSDFVEYGLSITPDHGNEQFDLGEGKAYVQQASAAGDASAETRHRLNYGVHVDATAGIDFATTSGVNYVWIDANVDEQDSPQIVVETNDAAPSDASLKIGTIDAANDTATEINREPSGGFRTPFSVEGPTGALHLNVADGGPVEVDGDAEFHVNGATARIGHNLVVGRDASGFDPLIRMEYDGGDRFSFRWDEANSILRIRDDANVSTMLAFHPGEKVAVPTSPLEVNSIEGNAQIVQSDAASNLNLKTNGSGDGSVRITDEANGVDRLIADEGSPIRVPLTDTAFQVGNLNSRQVSFEINVGADKELDHPAIYTGDGSAQSQNEAAPIFDRYGGLAIAARATDNSSAIALITGDVDNRAERLYIGNQSEDVYIRDASGANVAIIRRNGDIDLAGSVNENAL